MAEHARHLGFVEEELAISHAAGLILQRLRQCYLQRDITASKGVVGKVDDPHAAAADLTDDLVLA